MCCVSTKPFDRSIHVNISYLTCAHLRFCYNNGLFPITPVCHVLRLCDNMADIDTCVEIVKRNVKSYQDFPKPGILFRDIFSVMNVPEAFNALQGILIQHVKTTQPQPQIVVGLESRGFLLGPLIALEFQIPFVPIRKRGKLPGKLKQQSYELEYGMDTFEIQIDSITKEQKVLIVDDLLASGGSLQAACHLLTQLGAQITECLVVMELVGLKGRDKVPAPVHSVLQY